MIDTIRGYAAPVLGPLEWPLYWVTSAANLSLPGWAYLVYDILAIALVFLLVRYVIKRFLEYFRKDTLAEKADIDALVSKNRGGSSAGAVAYLPERVAQLREVKDWAGIGEAYAAAQKHEEAAKWFKKGKEFERAAVQMQALGKHSAAARLFVKAGKYTLAGNELSAQGRHRAAARHYVKDGNQAAAARAFGKARKHGKALELYLEYFQHPRDDPRERLRSASECYSLLQDKGVRDSFGSAERNELLQSLARCFEGFDKYDIAAQLYESAGAMELAGEAYVSAGHLERAAKCMEAAGEHKKSARIGGRFYEKQKKFREAGMSYAAADEFEKAGECFAKAGEFVRAGEYFAKSQSFYRSGLAYAKANRLEEAVGALQKVPDDSDTYDPSRALLGHCFYDLHDYEHCVATLENHLLGKRVDKQNIELFYKLALAQEQLGNLDESRSILYKVGAVNRNFRDVSQRISSIDTRISMLKGPVDPSGYAPAGTGGDASPATVQMMQVVEDTLGDRYEFEREIGRGGMGIVYLAHDKHLDRKVALKFLGNLVDQSEEYRQRFVREAKAAAKINHPNIVAIYDISASEGRAYIAMEFIEGLNLHKYIERKGALSMREAVNVMIQACNALHALHGAGIVHRDIKPENLIISRGGLVKLMDFGLAKAEDNRITRQNLVMGTPAYMAPEQAMGKETDGRSDVYAMGLVFYEMLTGKAQFLEGNVLERQVHETPAPLSELVEGLPKEIDAIALRCVDKDPDKRFQTAKDVVKALRAIPQPDNEGAVSH